MWNILAAFPEASVASLQATFCFLLLLMLLRFLTVAAVFLCSCRMKCMHRFVHVYIYGYADYISYAYMFTNTFAGSRTCMHFQTNTRRHASVMCSCNPQCGHCLFCRCLCLSKKLLQLSRGTRASCDIFTIIQEESCRDSETHKAATNIFPKCTSAPAQRGWSSSSAADGRPAACLWPPPPASSRPALWAAGSSSACACAKSTKARQSAYKFENMV